MADTTVTHLYEIRDRTGRVKAQWRDPKLTPEKDILLSMKRAEHYLYIDGKKQR